MCCCSFLPYVDLHYLKSAKCTDQQQEKVLMMIANNNLKLFYSIIAILLITACSSQVPQPSEQKVAPIDSEDTIFRKAETFFRQKNFNKAIEFYSEYILRYPQGEMSDAALYKLGLSYAERNQNGDALNYFKNLIETYPESPLVIDAKIEILAVYQKQGRFKELEQDASKILQNPLHDTQQQRINRILGDAYAAAGYPIKAVQHYDRMLQLSSESSRSDSFDRVQSAVKQLNTEQIKQLLESLHPGSMHSHLLFYLGQLYCQEKKYSAAESIFRELLEGYPNFKEKERVVKTLDSIVSGEIFKPNTLGCLLPLSGAYSVYGQRALQGIELALIHFSQNTSDVMPKLIVKDTKSDPEHAKNELKIMAKDGVAAIIGPMATAEQVAMEADALGVPILTLTQKEYITDSGPYVFRNFITPEMQVKTLVNYSSGTLGTKRFAILYPKENYGMTFMDFFWDEVVVHDGTVVGAEAYHIGQTDFADAIKKLVGLFYPMSQDTRSQALAHAALLRDPEEALQFFEIEDNPLQTENETEIDLELSEASEDPEELESIVDFNAVFIPDSPKMVGLIIPQLAYYDIRDVYLLGTNIWHSDSLIHMSRQYLNKAVVVDGFFAESDAPNIQEFVFSFLDVYKEKPEIIAATAYDSTMLILNLLNDPAITLRREVKDRLLTMQPYRGVTGMTTFRPNGDVSKDLFILGVSGGHFVELGRLNPYPMDTGLASEESGDLKFKLSNEKQ